MLMYLNKKNNGINQIIIVLIAFLKTVTDYTIDRK